MTGGSSCALSWTAAGTSTPAGWRRIATVNWANGSTPATWMAAYGELQEMQELEQKHKDMHALVKHVVELKHAGKAGEAEEGFSRVHEPAEDVIALINRVEAQVIGSRAHAVARLNASARTPVGVG